MALPPLLPVVFDLSRCVALRASRWFERLLLLEGSEASGGQDPVLLL
jgi:hypothetical protein